MFKCFHEGSYLEWCWSACWLLVNPITLVDLVWPDRAERKLALDIALVHTIFDSTRTPKLQEIAGLRRTPSSDTLPQITQYLFVEMARDQGKRPLCAIPWPMDCQII